MEGSRGSEYAFHDEVKVWGFVHLLLGLLGCTLLFSLRPFLTTPSILCDTMVVYVPHRYPSVEELAHSVKSFVPMMFGNMLAFHIVATLCMCLRFYSKRVSRAKYFIDDYVLIISWLRNELSE